MTGKMFAKYQLVKKYKNIVLFCIKIGFQDKNRISRIASMRRGYIFNKSTIEYMAVDKKESVQSAYVGIVADINFPEY